MSLQEAKQFVGHFVSGDYTPEEYATFLQWLRGATVDELNAIADEHEALHESWPVSSVAPSPEWVTILEGKLDELVQEKGEVPVVPIGRNRFMRRRTWVTAASVVIVLSVGAIWYAQRSDEGKVVKTDESGAVVPELSKMMYNPAGGGQKEFVLADGSKVWLNSASTLKYPAVFTGPERVVALSGEAFFEVAKSADKPFRVQIKDAGVEVLGTHFNIMAYDDEPTSKTTLIDGAVRMESSGEKIDLKPGQQVQLTYSSANGPAAMKIVTGVDADAVIAWRKGNIDFTDADLHTVMRALKRYYNVDIQYAEDFPGTKTITGSFLFEDGLERNLKLLGGFFNLHFKTDGKIVTVTR